MHKWFEVTFKVYNAQVWQFKVQIRHAIDMQHAERLARYLIKPATMMECVSVVEIGDQVPRSDVG